MRSTVAYPPSSGIRVIPILLRWIVFGAIVVLAGCHRRDPMEMTVRTSPPTEYRVWQSRHARQFAPDQRRRLEDALQDIRLKIMGDREASGSEGIDARFSL